MNFKDYFKLEKDKEQQAKDLHQQALNLYKLYFDYIVEELDDYNHEANITVIVQGYNYFDNTIDDFGAVHLYGPYVFDNKIVELVWQPINKKMIQIWDDHIFVDGVEKGKFKYDFSKSYFENHKQLLEKQTVERIKEFDYKNLDDHF